jgi:prepilin-type N-terminal cleavage/methylation domain-containing protein
MKIKPFKSLPKQHGFSLIELLITISLMGILASVVVSAVSNTAIDASRMVARQQQAAVHSAVMDWVASQARPNSATLPRLQSLATIRTKYNGEASKLTLIKDFISSSTYDDFFVNSSGSNISSEALRPVGASLEFPPWKDDEDEPRVVLNQ